MSDGYKDRLLRESHQQYLGLLIEHRELKAAVIALYCAGRWECDALTPEQQASLWEDVRDKTGIAKGTATKLGMGG